MTGKEMDNFYCRDERKYIVKENREFLNWYKEQIEKNYHPYFDLEQIQGLIDKIVEWYEIKYPNTIFDSLYRTYNIPSVPIVSEELTIDQFKYRITHDEREFLDCNYRGNCFCDQLTGINLYVRNGSQGLPELVIIYADKNGNVDPYSLNKLKDFLPNFQGQTTLNDILKILQEKYKFDDRIDFTELEHCVLIHQIDLELRNKILYLASLAILYSDFTRSEIGALRAKRLIFEFNEYYQLKLNTDELNRIMVRDSQEKSDEFETNEEPHSKPSKRGISFFKEKLFKRRVRGKKQG